VAEILKQSVNPEDTRTSVVGAVTRGLVHTADWEGKVRAVVNCRVCEIVLALELVIYEL
jgi:hypothetical protein